MIRPQTVSRYASMVKFSHTIFAMPFALVGYAYALQTTDAEFSLLLLVKVLLAMVFARNTAMGFNRYADRRIDALNPRTRNREIPGGHNHPAPGADLRDRQRSAVPGRRAVDQPAGIFPRARQHCWCWSDTVLRNVLRPGVTSCWASRSESLRWALTSR